ncbi:DUF935 domain-containing protein [Vogesella sp. AC12]|uniref:DUF935 domain-containing protein n=1 Tax=Vogesella sp. AC12 TaxID=2950550 RepID=UPI0021093339|nr:DUF935 domain-containing protein [Vogesella sp. AC12]MCQ4142830.1 DUF935 domain-containing protein [Vogesella sp. AC12]
MLVDHNGQPFASKSSELQDEQTAALGGIASRWPEHPSRGLTPQRLVEITDAAERGDIAAQHELFADMEEKDGHIATELGKRKLAVLGLEWQLLPPPNATAAEKKLAEEVADWLNNLDMEDLLFDMADALGHGFSAIEMPWDTTGKVWLPKKLEHRPQRWFQFKASELRLRSESQADGEALRPFNWIIHKHKSRSGITQRVGLHRALVWPFVFKNYSVRDLAEFLEIYGLPMRLGKYPPGATDKEKATLLRAVASIGHSAAGIIPEGMEIEFQNAASGTHEPFAWMVDWCERTESKIILGGTLTTQADGKSSTHALGKVHDEVRKDLRNADAKQLARTVTAQVVWPMVLLNKPGMTPDRCPRFSFNLTEAESLEQFAKSLPKLAESGMCIPVSWAHERLQIPMAGKDEPILQVAKPPPTAPVEALRYRVALKAENGDVLPADQLAVDEASGKLDGQAVEDAAARMLAPVIEALKQGASPEQAQDMLAELFDTMPEQDMAELLARAIFVADLWGRINA